MNYTGLKFWLDFAWCGITIAVGVYAWFIRREAARQKDMEIMGNRVVRLESNMLTHKDLGKVHERINDVSVQVAGLSGQITAMSGGLESIHNHLLNKDKKK